MLTSFEYLICLDFEATCWEKRNPEKAEIVEIGAVLLNLKNGAIESEFQRYVRPVQNPILSDYCVNLTGISQELINRQQTFSVVYKQFIDWLNQIGNEKQLRYATPNARTAQHSNATFCSWTNWDLGHYFRLDCGRNSLQPPTNLKAWIDARKIFERKYPGRYTFAEALTYINVEHTNSHSAIDDVKSLAKMLAHLYNRDVKFVQVTDWKNY